MKRNKKLMLTAIAAMGVVAMGVGGAGTFAWYSVEKSVASSSASAAVATSSVGIAGSTLQVIMDITPVTDDLELTNFNDAEDDPETLNVVEGKYETWYLVNNNLVEKTWAENEDMIQSQTYTVTNFAFDSSAEGFNQEIADALIGETIDVTLEAASTGKAVLLSGGLTSSTAQKLDVATASFKLLVEANAQDHAKLTLITTSGNYENVAVAGSTVTGNYRIQANTLDDSDEEASHEALDIIKVKTIAVE